MVVVGKLGCIFGFCGKMLNLKMGMVMMDVGKVVCEVKVGKFEYCIDCGVNVYVMIGKKSFDEC